MDIEFKCERCGQNLSVDETGVGLALPCPTCGHNLTVPERSAPAPVLRVQPLNADAGPRLALWNPNVAAAWSFIFTPVFGSILLSSNYRALGNNRKASGSLVWAFVGVALLLVSIMIQLLFSTPRTDIEVDWRNWASMATAVVFFVVWYIAEAQPQQRCIKQRLGGQYTKRSWVRPVSVAVLCMIGFVMVPVIPPLLHRGMPSIPGTLFHVPHITEGPELVTEAHLQGYMGTTVGNAFNTFFTEPKWELNESANKTRFVQFTGRCKKDSGLPEGSTVTIQFTLNADRSFQLTYAGLTDVPKEMYDDLSNPERRQAVGYTISILAAAGKEALAKRLMVVLYLIPHQDKPNTLIFRNEGITPLLDLIYNNDVQALSAGQDIASTPRPAPAEASANVKAPTTLVVKGLYVGMPITEALSICNKNLSTVAKPYALVIGETNISTFQSEHKNIILHKRDLGFVTFTLSEYVIWDGKITAGEPLTGGGLTIECDSNKKVKRIYCNEAVVDAMFNTKGVSPDDFARKFSESYRLPELKSAHENDWDGWEYLSDSGWRLRIVSRKLLRDNYVTTKEIEILAVPTASQMKFN
jgi:DNA-directed RNA polymerase subunit RPC12/RpoP